MMSSSACKHSPTAACYKFIYHKLNAMKHLLLSLLLLGAATTASAQYYQLANQLTNLISPALSGSMSYRGYVEATGTAGVGHSRANFAGISTSQGFRYSSWFFMGAGLGIDVAMARGENSSFAHQSSYYGGYNTTRTQVMLPVFSDFRFNIGPETAASCYIGILS